MNNPPLYKFQSHDINHIWWKMLNGRGIFDYEVGTGKTFLGAHIVERKPEWKILIIAPAGLLSDWRNNLLGRDIPSTTILTRKTKRPQESRVTLCAPDRLAKIRQKYDLIITDECHRFKSSTSTRGKLWRILNRESKHILMMSGTLSNNRDPMEYLNYLWAINSEEIINTLPPNITQWKNNYCNSKQLPNMMVPLYFTTPHGAKLISGLMDKHTCTRELRKELDIPPFIEKTIKVDSEVSMKSIIKRYEKELGIEIDEKYEKPHLTHTLMMASGIDYDTGLMANTIKFEAIYEIIESSNKPVIVWIYWKVFGVELQKYLEKKKIKADLINGDTKNKQELVDKFKAGSKVLIASLGTIAEGHNLQHCSREIVANIYYDIIKSKQGRGRIERAGQKERMYSTTIIGKDSMEVEVLKVLKQKKSLAASRNYLEGILQKRYWRKG